MYRLAFFTMSLMAVAVSGQEDPNTDNYVNGYPCVEAKRPCDTFVHYRAQSPGFLSLSNISELFNTNQFDIAYASSLPSDTTTVSDGEDLLIPIKCDCTKPFVKPDPSRIQSNYSLANIPYQIQSGDTFYLISIGKFGNLTTYQAIEKSNPKLVVTDLQIGTWVNLPLRCQCPTEAQRDVGITTIVTYVVQPGDTLEMIAKKLGANLKFLNVHSPLIPYNTLLVSLSGKPVLDQRPTPSPPHRTPGPGPTSPLPPPHHSSTLSNKLYKITSIAESVALLTCLGLFLVCLSRRTKRQQSYSPTNNDLGLSYATAKARLLTGVPRAVKKLAMYSLEDIQNATDYFSPEFRIHGSSVYKGTIDGKPYAIKVMKEEDEASSELKFLQKAHHTNLVQLQGLCMTCYGQSYLVYEYVDNDSLHTWLHNHERNGEGEFCGLTWTARLQIAVDVACGLHYIHDHTVPSVVHKDIKSSNILLDSKLRAKIANFGMVRSGLNAVTKNIVGTQGYMAPEYLAEGLVAPMMDIFAFGVVLLEIISGKEAVIRENGVAEGLLWVHAKGILEGDVGDVKEKVKEWMDVRMWETCSLDNVVGVAMLAKACVEEDPSDRPSIAEIVFKLSKALDACRRDRSLSKSVNVGISEIWPSSLSQDVESQ